MIDRPFEDLIAGWYRSRAAAEPLPERLRARVLVLPEQPSLGRRPLTLEWRPRSTVLFVAVLGALLLALAMTAAGMVPRLFPDRILAFRSGQDACAVLRDATNTTREFDHGMTAWGAHVCAVGWDGGWNNPHLLLRVVPTTAGEAGVIIANRLYWQENARPSPPPDGDQDRPPLILAVANGTWMDYAPGVWMGCPAPGESPFLALAVSVEPYFFIVTGMSSRVRQVAADVARQLGIEVPGLESLGQGPTCAPRP